MTKKAASIALALTMALSILSAALPVGAAAASGDNTSFGSAAPVALFESVTVNFNIDGQERYYTFIAPKEATYTFQSSNKGDTDPIGTLYDSDMVEISSDDDSGGPQSSQEDFLIMYALSAKQQVYIKAECYPGRESAHTGSYTLTVGLLPSMKYFEEANSYTSGQFSDVDENQWYGSSAQGVIATAYKYGLMRGSGGTTFNPGGNVTVAEAITVAARVRNIYNGGSGEFTQGDPWYQVYVDYAVSSGIIADSDFTDYNRAATRAEMAYIFSRSMPPAEFTRLNIVSSLPDVNADTPYSDSIITLYSAGIVTGSDAIGTFNPGANITRAEAAAIISRVILPGTRTGYRTYTGLASGDNTAQEAAGNDTLSMIALQGSWKNLQYTDNGYFWVFGIDGSFAYFHVNQTSHGAGSTRWDFASNYMIRGRFRVKGYTLEFYDCQVSGNNALTENLLGGNTNEAWLSMLTTPMSNPQEIEDFYAEFEFNDALSLRIAPDDSGNFDNDIEYYYGGDSHYVAVPTHLIPSRDWPGELLPSSIPEYGDGGRIRRVATQARGEDVLVYIDWTSPTALSDYLDRLLHAGCFLPILKSCGFD